jgi:hypothetical protein
MDACYTGVVSRIIGNKRRIVKQRGRVDPGVRNGIG